MFDNANGEQGERWVIGEASTKYRASEPFSIFLSHSQPIPLVDALRLLWGKEDIPVWSSAVIRSHSDHDEEERDRLCLRSSRIQQED